jgi:hypothetical protein
MLASPIDQLKKLPCVKRGVKPISLYIRPKNNGFILQCAAIRATTALDARPYRRNHSCSLYPRITISGDVDHGLGC